MTTGLYRCTGCNRQITAPEGLCASCFRDLKIVLAREKQARKDRKKKRKKK